MKLNTGAKEIQQVSYFITKPGSIWEKNQTQLQQQLTMKKQKVK